MSDNDTLQKLLDAGKPIAQNTYQIDMTKPLLVKDGAVLDLRGSVFRGIPNDQDKGAILKIQTATDVVVLGGVFYGDKTKHKNAGPYGNGSHGISITKGSRNVSLDGPKIFECMGDGIYIDDASDVLVKAVVALNNRRQGLSLIGGQRIHIEGSEFSNTTGTRPGCGIDIEPDKGDAVDGVVITKCKFFKNDGPHVLIHSKRGPVKNVKVFNNTFDTKSQPVKVNNDPRFDPVWYIRLKGKLLGDYSGYVREVTLP